MKNLLQQPITDIRFIKKLIPQKDPFVMVDRLLYFDETKGISGLLVSEKNILSSETHFSEAGLIENMAQTIALHGSYGAFVNKAEGPAKRGFLGAVKKLEIFELPKINARIETHIEVLHDIMGVKLSNSVIKNENNKILASATIKTVIVGD